MNHIDLHVICPLIDEHPDTPWAMLAKRELDTPLGWEWKEEFTDLSPRRAGAGSAGRFGA